MEQNTVKQNRRAGRRGAIISPLPPVIPAWREFSFTTTIYPNILNSSSALGPVDGPGGRGALLVTLGGLYSFRGEMTVCLCDEGSSGNLNSQRAG